MGSPDQAAARRPPAKAAQKPGFLHGRKAFVVAFYVAIPAIVATLRKPQPKLVRNHIGLHRFCRLWA
jgi:hypothetical protein